MQTIAITFTGAPIPFGKVGGFPPESIKKIIEEVKKGIKDGKDALNALKQDFNNAVNEINNRIEVKLDEISKDNFKQLRESLPEFFSRAGTEVAAARQELLNLIGTVDSYSTSNRILNQTIRQWADIGNDSLYGAVQGYKGHTDEISGVLLEDKVLTLQKIPAFKNIGSGNTVAGSSTISPNLSSTIYPKCNVADTLIVNGQQLIVKGKNYSAASGGNVRVNSGSIIVYTTNLTTLNLANASIDTGSNLKLSSGMYIKVNNEIHKINTINALGDYLTVYRPFKNGLVNPTTGVTLNKEYQIVVNTAATSTSTNVIIKVQDYQCANSLCLDDVITGDGTLFLNYLSVGDKIYYDNKEYFVKSVNNEKIVVDEDLRLLSNQIVSKVIGETPVTRLAESNGPDDILDVFDTVDIFTSSFSPGFADDLSTVYRKADGTYSNVLASKPIHATKAIAPEERERINAVNQVVQNLIDELQNDAINFLTDNELVNLINEKKQQILSLKNNLIDIVNQDLAAINAVKGLISALLKLFKASCSKKKKSNDPAVSDESSDEYLRLILKPNPLRQGCEATENNLIDLLDQSDQEYNEVTIPTVNTAGPAIANTNPAIFDEQETLFIPEMQQDVGGSADIGVDKDPEQIQPPRTKDPCSEPC